MIKRDIIRTQYLQVSNSLTTSTCSTFHYFLITICIFIIFLESINAAPPLKKLSPVHKLSGGGGEIALRRVVADTSRVNNLTRNHNGDIFYSTG